MSIVKVECHGCRAPYQVEERRIPPTGLKMKCPKCGTSLLVTRGGADDADLPAAAPAKKPGAPAGPPPRPAPKGAPPAQKITAPYAAVEPEAIGEIEAEADLPATAPTRKPGAPPPRPTAPGGAEAARIEKATTPRGGRATGGTFGEIDLMVDLPSPASFGSMDEPGDLGVDDLPAVPAARSSAPGFGEIEGFGDVDLPVVQPGGRGDLPVAARNASGLPAALGRGTKPRGPADSFGEIDLPVAGRGSAPSLEAELPAPFGARETRPRAAHDGAFGEIDLPLASGPSGDLPVSSGTGLPSVAVGSALPSIASGSALPLAAGPGLPAPVGGAALPAPAAGGALPAPVAGGALPTVQATGLPSTSAAGMPIVAPGATSLPMNVDGFGLEEDLGGGAGAAPGANPYDDTDRTAPGEAGALGSGVDLGGGLPRGQIGDEADLAAPPVSGRVRPAPQTDAPAAPVKRSNKARIAVALLVVVAIGGGSLALVPSMGPFGANFISDQLNAKAYAQALEELRAHVDAGFDEDTAAGAGRAVDEAKEAQTARPRHKPTMSFAAYATLARSLRFGKRGDDEAYAKQLMAQAGPEPGPEKALASAADLAVHGDLPQAKELANGVLTTSPQSVDAAALVGEIDLAAKSKDAVASWKRAVGIKASARTLFGLARAGRLTGDEATAKDAAEKALKTSPAHPGAHILLGSLLWTKDADEAGALGHLKKVTEEKVVRANASDGELVQAFTWIGRIHLAKSRAGAAEQAFAAALKLDPQAVEALIGNGELFFHAGRFSEALARFEAATRADAASIVAKVGVAKSYLALERMKEAKDLLKREEKAHPKEPLVLLWLGRSEEALNNRKEAEAAYRAAITAGGAKPEVVEAYVALAHLLTTNGKPDDAAKALAQASEKFPDLPALHRAKGEVALSAGQYEEAKKELEAALEKENDLGARFKLAVTERHLRDYDAATKLIDEVAEADKDYPGVALERGLLFEEQGQSEKALEMYDAALKKAPNDPDLKLRVGSTQVIAGHPELAEKMLREVIKERPSSAEVNHFLGRAILLRGGNLAEAQRFLQKAIDFDSNRAEYHLYVGWVANQTGNAGLADAELRRALELDQNLGDAYWQRGVLLQKQGQSLDALQSLQTALEKRPSRFEAYATMALCYQDQQRWPEAEASWRKAIAGNDGVPEWHYRLGKIFASHGNKAAAMPELEKAVAGEPSDKAPPAWAVDAHLLLGEGLRGSDRAKALQHYERFLVIAPSDNPYRKDAETAVAALGGKKPL